MPFNEDALFTELLARLQIGDQSAEALVHRRYVRRLIALASTSFETALLRRIDVEGIVQSACKSFFLRNRMKSFKLTDWEDIWFVMAMITRRKCLKRLRFERAGRRFFGRELPLDVDGVLGERLSDREPTAHEVIAAREIQNTLMAMMEPDDRRIVALFLEGHTAEASARRLGCSIRTVGRVRKRAKTRLSELIGD